MACSMPSGGGGGPFNISTVNSMDAVLIALSGSSSQPLYQTTMQSFTLNIPISGGSYFALVGSEGSGPLTCTLDFKDSLGTEITGVVVQGDAGTNAIVRDPGFSPDTYVRFYFDGVNVSYDTIIVP